MAGETILVAEDEPASRLVMVHVLQVAGFHVLAAHDGREALAIAGEHRDAIAAVVTDCYMPELDGLGLARAIRGLLPRRVPVIMVTSLEYSLAPEALIESGVDYVMGKPFSPKAITRLLRDVLEDWADRYAEAS